MKLSFFICIFLSYRNFHGHVGNFIWKIYYIALRLCNKIVYASSRNLYARSLKIRKINYFLTWISYIFDDLKFDLGINNFRCNLNKLLSIASLWTHCWKDTILTSSSDIYCNFYRLCPWLPMNTQEGLIGLCVYTCLLSVHQFTWLRTIKHGLVSFYIFMNW